jgi:putative ABC transport system permease protein
MKSNDLIKLSTRMFKARTGRTVLTVFGMGIGIGAILFLVGLGYGLQKTLLQAITTSESLLTIDVMPNEENSGLRLDKDRITEFSEMKEVAEVSPAVNLPAKINFEDLTSDAVAVFIEPSFLKLSGAKASQGSLLKENNSRQVVISSALSKVFNEDPAGMIGKSFSFAVNVPGEAATENSQEKLVSLDAPFEISGVIESEDVLFYVQAGNLNGVSPIAAYSQVKVKCRTSGDLNQVKSQLSEEGFSVSALSEKVDEITKLFNIINVILALFGVVALSVSAIGMFNTMTVALMERIQEIGIMKAVGASRRDIFWMFVTESTVMGFFGGLCGIVLGYVAGRISNAAINFIAARFGGQPIELFFFPFWFVALILAFAVFVGFATGVVPARRAGATDPLSALQYK